VKQTAVDLLAAIFLAYNMKKIYACKF